MFWPTLVTHMSRQTAARLLQGLLGFLSLDYWLGYSANVRRLVLVKQSQNLIAAVLPFMQVLDFLQQRRTSRPDHSINFINAVLILALQTGASETSGSVMGKSFHPRGKRKQNAAFVPSRHNVSSIFSPDFSWSPATFCAAVVFEN